MSKPDAPEAPDYSGVAAASEKAAKLNFKLGQQQLDWAKEQYAKDSGVFKKVINSFLGDMKTTSQNAEEDRAFYENNFQPMEKQLAKEAQGYDTAQRRASEMGKAEAGVSTQFDAARENATQQLESYGIDPSSTRYAALDIGMRAAQAAAQAGAGETAQKQVEDTGRALRTNAVNIGRGYPAQVASGYGTSAGFGSGAMQGTMGATQTASTSMTQPSAYMGAGNQAINNWGDILHQGYTDQLNQFTADQQSSSGIGGLVGTLGGMALKHFWADGGVIPEDGAPPQNGGPVDASMSPSGGQQTDDVPAQLNEGEFVIPDDVVSWYGEKHFYNLIDKTAKEREQAKQQTGAVPEEHMAPSQPPAYQSA